ncbi:MAG: hypothetical protein N2512_00235 [Armatimonadetes bacterium]|nr:hypothetical protein [Armatimonadota bacterium]
MSYRARYCWWAALVAAAMVLLAWTAQAPAQEPAGLPDAPAEDYSALLRRAVQAVREGHFNDAAEAYQRAFEAAGTDAQRAAALLGKADLLSELEQYSVAADTYAQAGRLAGAADHQRVRAWLGAARTAAAAGKVKLAVEANEWLASSKDVTDADRAAALGRLADIHYEDGEVAKAETLWRRLADEFSSYPPARTARQKLVESYLGRNDLEALRRLLAGARAANQPDAEGLHVYAATRLASGGKLRLALEICEALLAWRPFSEAGWAQAWHLHEQLGDAETFLQSALERARRDTQVAQGLAGVAENLASSPRAEQRTRSLALYELLLDAAPGSPRLLYGGARVALDAGRADLADRWSARLVEAQPNDTSAQAVRGRVLAALNRRDEALAALKQAAHYSPDDVDSARYLLAMLEDAGLADEAPAVVAEVRAVTGDPSVLSVDLAMAYQRRGQWKEAVAELAKALASGEASASYVTGLFYQWLADPAAAKETAEAMDELSVAGSLPRPMLPAYVCLLFLNGRQKDMAARLSGLLAEERGGVVLQAAQLLKLLGRDDLAPPLYEAALESGLPPEAEQEVALRVAEDLLAAGRAADARRLLQEHRKPGMPWRLAATYDLVLAELLLAVGAVDEAESLLQNLMSRPARVDAARTQLLLGESAFRRGDYSSARRILQSLAAGSTAMPEAPEMPPAPPLPPGVDAREAPGLVMTPYGGRGTALNNTAAHAAFILAEMALREDRLDEARKGYLAVVASAAATRAATSAVGRIALLSALAELDDDERRRFLVGLKLLDAGDMAQARSLWADWLDQPSAPVAAYARMLLAEALEASDPSRAAEEYEQLAKALPDAALAPVAMYRAALLRASTQPPLAVALASRLKERYPDSALAPVAAQLAEELSRP